MGSIAEKALISLWRFYSPPSASPYLDYLIAHQKQLACSFQCFGGNTTPYRSNAEIKKYYPCPVLILCALPKAGWCSFANFKFYTAFS
jgi:hypothetical protein